MPDDIKISEMSEAASLDNSAQFPYVQSVNGTLTTLKAPLSQIGTKINEGMTFSNLQTTSKNIVGAINEIDTKTTLVKSASGSLVHITDGGDNIPMKSLESEIVAVETGSGTPSPSNPRAISGFNSGVVSVYAKYHRIIVSTLTPQTQNGITITPFADGHFEISGTATVNITLYFNIPTFTIYGEDTRTVNFNNDFANNDVTIGFLKDSTVIDSWSMNSLNRTYTNYNALANRECNVLSVSVSNGVSVSGSFKVEFLVINSGTTYTFSFGQTVYGGHFDNKGNLVVTHGKFKISDLTWTRSTSYSNPFFYSLLSDGLKNTLAISDKLNCISPTWSENFATVSNNHDFCIGAYSSQIFIRADEYTDATTFSSAGGMGNTEIVYELATPITLSITSQNIPTLSGVNNIFSNCGDLDIEYFTSSADDLAALIEVLSNS